MVLKSSTSWLYLIILVFIDFIYGMFNKKKISNWNFFLSTQNYIMYYGNIKQEGDLVKLYIRTLQELRDLRNGRN